MITQPDRPGNRGRPAPRPVADAAAELGIEVWQPELLRQPAVVERLLGLELDAMVVAAYGQIVPGRLLDALPLGGINVHASLLPRWRGASPVVAAILAGDEVTGVSIMRMDAGVDTGPVFATRSVPIPPRMTAPVLTGQLADLGAELLAEVLPPIAAGQLAARPQDPAAATAAPRLTRSDAVLDWGVWPAVDVDRRVRALDPWPGVVAPLAGTHVHLLAGRPLDGVGSGEPGRVAHSSGDMVAVSCAGGTLYGIESLRAPSGRAMSGAAFLRGRPSAGA